MKRWSFALFLFANLALATADPTPELKGLETAVAQIFSTLPPNPQFHHDFEGPLEALPIFCERAIAAWSDPKRGPGSSDTKKELDWVGTMLPYEKKLTDDDYKGSWANDYEYRRPETLAAIAQLWKQMDQYLKDFPPEDYPFLSVVQKTCEEAIALLKDAAQLATEPAFKQGIADSYIPKLEEVLSCIQSDDAYLPRYTFRAAASMINEFTRTDVYYLPPLKTNSPQADLKIDSMYSLLALLGRYLGFDPYYDIPQRELYFDDDPPSSNY